MVFKALMAMMAMIFEAEGLQNKQNQILADSRQIKTTRKITKFEKTTKCKRIDAFLQWHLGSDFYDFVQER